MSLISGTQGKAALILDNWGNSIAGEKDKFLSAFGRDSTVRAQVEANKKKAMLQDFDDARLFRQNENRAFTQTQRLNSLSLKIVFGRDGQPTVTSDQLSTITSNGTSAVLSSKAQATWITGQEQIDAETSKAVVTALDIQETDVAGKLPGQPNATIDIATRYWTQKHVELAEEISTSVVGGQPINPEGINPQDVANVLRWWSGHCGSNQALMEAEQEKYALSTREEGAKRADKSFADIASVSLHIFRNNIGRICVAYEQNLLDAKGYSFQLKGLQRWVNLADENDHLKAVNKSAFKAVEYAKGFQALVIEHAAKKGATGFGAGATAKLDPARDEVLLELVKMQKAPDRALAFASHALALEEKGLFTGMTAKTDKLLEERRSQVFKAEVLDRAEANRGYSGRFLNVATVGYAAPLDLETAEKELKAEASKAFGDGFAAIKKKAAADDAGSSSNSSSSSTATV